MGFSYFQKNLYVRLYICECYTCLLLSTTYAVLVEKILRVQPEVRKLYLLVRAPDAIAAEERVLTEVQVQTSPQIFLSF